MAAPSSPSPLRPPSLPLGGRLQRRLEAAWLEDDGLGRWLAPLGWLVARVSALRRAAWQRRWRTPVDVGVPVVVVGNLVAGGAGKTPVVLAIVAALQAAGHRPGIVSRGYGGRTGASGGTNGVLEVEENTPAHRTGDEPLLLRRRSGCPVVVGADRVAAAQALRAAHPTLSVIVSDDGLQHRRLARSVEIIVFDERGVGNGRCLPAGPLREPMPARAPDASVVVYNADQPSTHWNGRPLHRSLTGAVSLQDWWQGRPARPEVLLALRGEPLVAAAGTARPGRFFKLLTDAGIDFAALPLPDHHPFASAPWPADTSQVIVTEKDAIKLDPDAKGGPKVWVAPLDCRLPAETVREVMALLPSPPAALQPGNDDA